MDQLRAKIPTRLAPPAPFDRWPATFAPDKALCYVTQSHKLKHSRNIQIPILGYIYRYGQIPTSRYRGVGECV